MQRKRTDVLSVKLNQKKVKKEKGKEKWPHFIFSVFLMTIVFVLSLFSSKDPEAWKACRKTRRRYWTNYDRRRSGLIRSYKEKKTKQLRSITLVHQKYNDLGTATSSDLPRPDETWSAGWTKLLLWASTLDQKKPLLTRGKVESPYLYAVASSIPNPVVLQFFKDAWKRWKRRFTL